MTISATRVIVIEKKGRIGRCWVTQSSPILRTLGGAQVVYKPRRWFTDDEDNLTSTQANYVLTNGRGEPKYEEILYIIISLREDEHRRLAGDDDRLYKAMHAATIEAMRELARGVEARKLAWIACVHSDYPHPCVKVLINRDIGKGRSKMLRCLPRRMRSHWLKQEKPGDPRVIVNGSCGDAFLRVFDKAARDRQVMNDEDDQDQIPELPLATTA